MPNDPKTKNRGFLGAFRKGVQAFKDGKTEIDNPYHYTPGEADTPYGCHITWVRAFYNYWRDGWKAAKEEINDANKE